MSERRRRSAARAGTGEHGPRERGHGEHGAGEHGHGEHGQGEHGASEHEAARHGAGDLGRAGFGTRRRGDSPGSAAGAGAVARFDAPFFLVPEIPSAGTYVLGGGEGRHAATVRRLRVGEPLHLTDGDGTVAPATVREVGVGELTLDVAPAFTVPAPQPRLVLVQALVKGERAELAVELATEAGVDAVVPWAAERCVARWSTGDKAAKGVARWTAVAREAAKQSRRPRVPDVGPLASTADVVRSIRRAAAALILHEAGTTPIRQVSLPAAGEVLLVVGPEGGLTPDEVRTLRSAGGSPVRLGPEVLRTSTAAAVALGALGVMTGRWA